MYTTTHYEGIFHFYTIKKYSLTYTKYLNGVFYRINCTSYSQFGYEEIFDNLKVCIYFILSLLNILMICSLN